MKRLLRVLGIWFICCGLAAPCLAADVKLSWDPSDGATGYRVYMSTDQGKTWDAGTDVGAVTTCEYKVVQDSGLILFRVSAYNSQSEAIRYEAGAWYCRDWLPPNEPTGIGIK